MEPYKNDQLSDDPEIPKKLDLDKKGTTSQTAKKFHNILRVRKEKPMHK
jgi:hypothetical protein